MEFSTELIDTIATIFQQAIVESVAQDPNRKIADLEQSLRQLLKQVGSQALSQGLTALEKQYPDPQVSCPCGQQADYQFRRTAKTLAVFG